MLKDINSTQIKPNSFYEKRCVNNSAAKIYDVS